MKVARDLIGMGFTIIATKGTAKVIREAGLEVEPVNKVAEGRPHIGDVIKNHEVVMVINTVEERRTAVQDSRIIRTSALAARINTITTIAGAEAAVQGIANMDRINVYDLQTLHKHLH